MFSVNAANCYSNEKLIVVYSAWLSGGKMFFCQFRLPSHRDRFIGLTRLYSLSLSVLPWARKDLLLSFSLSYLGPLFHEFESIEHCWWRGSAKGQSEAPGVALSSSYLFVLPTFVISLTAWTLWTSWGPRGGWCTTAKSRYCLTAQRACQITLEIKKQRRLLLSCWLHLTPCSSDLTPDTVLKRASCLTRMKRPQGRSRHAMLASFNTAVRIVCRRRSWMHLFLMVL